MPYLRDSLLRNSLDKFVNRWFKVIAPFREYLPPDSDDPDYITGTLNYFLFKLAKENCGTYKDYRNFIGELEAAKLEIYRRLVAPYEDIKIEENGDVK